MQNGDVMIKVFDTQHTININYFACILLHCTAQVVAAGVNRLDLIQAAGKYPPPPGESNILGVEGKYTCTSLNLAS